MAEGVCCSAPVRTVMPNLMKKGGKNGFEGAKRWSKELTSREGDRKGKPKAMAQWLGSGAYYDELGASK